MFQLPSPRLDGFASRQRANILRAGFCRATALGMDRRIVAAVMAVFYLWLALH